MEMNITENWLNELDSMTETDRRITLGSPEWKELIDFARQGLRLQEVEKWKAEQQQALITMAATLLSAGFKGDHVVHGVKWLACELEAAKRVIEAGWRLSNYSYMPWSTAGGPADCKHGICIGIHCERCDKELVDPAINAERKEKL